MVGQVNQELAHEALEFFVGALDEDILAASVIAEIFRAHTRLIKQFPADLISDFVERTVDQGLDPQARRVACDAPWFLLRASVFFSCERPFVASFSFHDACPAGGAVRRDWGGAADGVSNENQTRWH